ncbi:EpsG family protein [Nostoc sp.]|uniref:EpsG family protein n=1 Tax=Nostoc sp. TaxID=1180 RepID=UPI002FFC4B46
MMRIPSQKRTVLKKNVHSLNLYSIAFLFISLAIWFLVPIVGIFPLLLFVQVNLLKAEKPSKNIVFLNNLILILIFFTVCILFSSYTIYSDLVSYIQTYESLGYLNLLDATSSYGTGIEIIPFLIAYLVYKLADGSVYEYLFIHALIINGLVIFVISKKLSTKYYPLLLIGVFSTPFYYWQAVIMRHSLSNVFLMTAIAFIESSSVSFFSYLLLATFSHSSNFINVGILFILKIYKNKFTNIYLSKTSRINLQAITKTTIVIIFISAILFVFVGRGIPLTIVLPLLNLFKFGESYSLMLENKLINYESYDAMVGVNIVDKTIFLFMQIGVLISLVKTKKLQSKNLALIIIFSTQFVSYVSVIISLVNWRIYFLLISMHGLFYIPIIENIITRNAFWHRIIMISVAIIISYNFVLLFRGLTGGWIVQPEHIFFNGRPLEMNLFDYLEFFINATPNR